MDTPMGISLDSREAQHQISLKVERSTVSIILFLLFGLVVGVIARLIVPGREPGGWVMSIVLGIAGSFLGGLLGRTFGLYREGEPAGFVMSVIGAVIVVGIYSAIAKRARA
jgi:uncharacterized membrane protein YeaQ/YmgE (transglycosylase-associated protein family)